MNMQNLCGILLFVASPDFTNFCCCQLQEILSWVICFNFSSSYSESSRRYATSSPSASSMGTSSVSSTSSPSKRRPPFRHPSGPLHGYSNRQTFREPPQLQKLAQQP